MSFQLPAGLKPAQNPASGSRQGQGAGGPGGNGAGGEEAAEKARQQEEMKRGMIASMLASEARERPCYLAYVLFQEFDSLSRIALTRPELASRVEDLLIRMGQAGQIRGQVTDEALKGLLQQVTDAQNAKPKSSSVAPPSARTKSLGGGITIQRKRDDSDSDEYDL